MNNSIFSSIRYGTTIIAALFTFVAVAQEMETMPADPIYAKLEPVKAPARGGLLLQSGDRLAIIGDSITEQKMYSRIMETYLTVCAPELKITTRQFGWGGETAEGFKNRMKNDCLRFNPTVATLCYGMNDHKYRGYDEPNGIWYSNNVYSVVSALKASGARVVVGAPSCVGKTPNWGWNNTNLPMEDLNANLCRLRNIDIAIAAQLQTRFADVFMPLVNARLKAREQYGANYFVAGKDGVHPLWAGHLVMAYAFLSSMGLDGDIGAYTVDLAANAATVSVGHKLDGYANNTLTITSQRYPFCANDNPKDDNAIRSGMTLVPFNAELNRLKLIVKNGTAAKYQVTWGKETHSYTAAQLAEGINLAADFADNPFLGAFKKVDEAVAAKQNYETRQIQNLFHGPEGKADADGTAALTEKVRQPLTAAIAKAFVPVTHTISIKAE